MTSNNTKTSQVIRNIYTSQKRSLSTPYICEVSFSHRYCKRVFRDGLGICYLENSLKTTESKSVFKIENKPIFPPIFIRFGSSSNPNTYILNGFQNKIVEIIFDFFPKFRKFILALTRSICGRFASYWI